MKKRMNPQERMGKCNEERAIALTRSLKDIVPWIRNVKKAGTRLDRAGIDVKVFIKSPFANRDVLALMQVKSSKAHANLYARTHPECMKAGVILTVVNDHKTDELIRSSVLYALEAVRTNPVRHERFERLYATMRHTPLPVHSSMRKNRSIQNSVKKFPLCTCESMSKKVDSNFSCSNVNCHE